MFLVQFVYNLEIKLVTLNSACEEACNSKEKVSMGWIKNSGTNNVFYFIFFAVETCNDTFFVRGHNSNML